jgi:hypothetical protein
LAIADLTPVFNSSFVLQTLAQSRATHPSQILDLAAGVTDVELGNLGIHLTNSKVAAQVKGKAKAAVSKPSVMKVTPVPLKKCRPPRRYFLRGRQLLCDGRAPRQRRRLSARCHEARSLPVSAAFSSRDAGPKRRQRAARAQVGDRPRDAEFLGCAGWTAIVTGSRFALIKPVAAKGRRRICGRWSVPSRPRDAAGADGHPDNALTPLIRSPPCRMSQPICPMWGQERAP